MTEEEFSRIVEEEWDRVPEEYRDRIENVALLVEDEPSSEVREAEGLEGEETLLGLYQGIPLIERGEGYGSGATLPDTITIYRLPALHEAADLAVEGHAGNEADLVREVVRETLWHEIGHYFGWDEESIERREAEGSNRYRAV